MMSASKGNALVKEDFGSMVARIGDEAKFSSELMFSVSKDDTLIKVESGSTVARIGEEAKFLSELNVPDC